MKLSFDDLIWNGRYLDHDGIRYFDYSASGFCFVMKGKKAEATILSDPEKWNEENKGVLGIFVTEGSDTSIGAIPEEPTLRVTLREKENHITLFESAEEKTVCIRVMKFSECAFGYAGLKEVEIEGELKVVKPVETTAALKLEFIGDSITCGYGIEGVWEKDTFTTQQERPDKAYAFLTAKSLGADFHLCSWSGIGLTSNYVDPETVNLPDTHWLMQANWPYTDKSLSLRLGIEPEVWKPEGRFEPDIVIINLGTNDISWVRGIEDRRLNYVAQLRQLIEAVHRRSPKAAILCCLGIMGEALNDSVKEAVELFSKDFPAVKAKSLAFTQQLESDSIGADWHPSSVTHKKAAATLTAALKMLK